MRLTLIQDSIFIYCVVQIELVKMCISLVSEHGLFRASFL